MTNPFVGGAGGIDYSQYQTWEKIVAPSGAVYYVIPGTGRLLDPNLSASKGKPVTFADPRGEYEKRKSAEEQQKKMQDQAMFNASPLGQLIPIGGTVAGLYAANTLANGGGIGLGGLLGGGGGTAAAALPATPNVLGASVVSGAPAASAASAAPAATGVLGTGLGALPLAGIAAGTYLGGKAAYDMFQGKKPGLPGRVVLGMATGGLSELANKAGFLHHKSTKEYEADLTNELLGMSDSQQWQDSVNHLRSVEHPEGDKGENFNAKEALSAAKNDGKVLWGTGAVLKQFGPDWLEKYSEQQREEITRKLAQADLFDNKKGDWQITNRDQANQIRDSVLAGSQPVPITPAQAAAQGATGMQIVNPPKLTQVPPVYLKRA